MPPQGGGGGGQGDQGQGLDLIWGVAFVIIVILALWFFARGPILQGIFFIKLLEIKAIGLFTNSLEPVQQAILYYRNDPTAVSINQIGLWFHEIGRTLRFIVPGILTLLAGILYFTHPSLKFNHVFDMQRLRELEKDNWPQIIPVIKENLIDQDIDEGKWAMSPSPMQFAKKYGLLEEYFPESKVKSYGQKKPEVRVIKDKAEQVFAKQLGPVWRGLQKTPPHARALMAVFAAHTNQDKSNVSKLIEQFGRSSGEGKLDFTGVDEVLKKHYRSKPLQQAMHSHAYLYGVIASMLEVSRTSGVLSSSDFIWVKPLDRPLWYIVNTVGRRTCMSEIAGPISHWLAEKAMGRTLTQPMVKNAVKGLELAIKDIVYTPDEPEQGK
ncbi:MAG: type IVB secretion system coupling complex protein DotM/IcmP [Legionellales bacterium]|jgi:intracellular multiplication protein IcmP